MRKFTRFEVSGSEPDRGLPYFGLTISLNGQPVTGCRRFSIESSAGGMPVVTLELNVDDLRLNLPVEVRARLIDLHLIPSES